MRAAVIGAGLIAKQHLGALRALAEVEVVGLCDLSPVMAESTAERFAIDHWYTDYRTMLAQQRPEVVHIATPPGTHFALARTCLEAGAHVLVEKPITLELEDLQTLQTVAAQRERWLIEDHNYLFNRDVQQILSWVEQGLLGDVRHVDVRICLDLFATGSRFADRDLPHPAMRSPLGAASDFVTHLAYLAYALVGPHQRVQAVVRREAPSLPDAISELRVLVDAQHATASLSLSGTAQPDQFVLAVEGTRMRVQANLFERGIVKTPLRGGSPWSPIRNSLQRARGEASGAVLSLARKLSGGPGAYEGLWQLVAETYRRLVQGGPPPVSPGQILSVNRLIHDLQRHLPRGAA
jgi:predicted dehydrogenase